MTILPINFTVIDSMKTTHEQRIVAIKALRQGERSSKFVDELNDLLTMLETMQDFGEIQKTHDIMHFVVTNMPKHEQEHIFGNEEAFKLCAAAMESLCWVLRHAAKDTFDKNVMMLQYNIEKLGYKLRKVDDDQTPKTDGPGIS